MRHQKKTVDTVLSRVNRDEIRTGRAGGALLGALYISSLSRSCHNYANIALPSQTDKPLHLHVVYLTVHRATSSQAGRLAHDGEVVPV